MLMSTAKRECLDDMIKGIGKNIFVSNDLVTIRQVLHEIVRLMHAEEEYDNEIGKVETVIKMPDRS